MRLDTRSIRSPFYFGLKARGNSQNKGRDNCSTFLVTLDVPRLSISYSMENRFPISRIYPFVQHTRKKIMIGGHVHNESRWKERKERH